jgi:hypothetical protein
MKPKVLFFLSFALLLLLRPASAGTVVSSGSGTLHGTYTFSFDSGGEGLAPADVWWDIQTFTPYMQAQMVPFDKGIVNLGVVDFDSITIGYLESLAYGMTPIDGNNDNTNQLVNGDVFAVHTNYGNYAKVKVLQYGVGEYGSDLVIQWVTMAPGPSEGFPSPILAFLGTNNYTGSDGNTYTSYNLSVTNWQLYPAELFTLTSAYGSCGENSTPSRTWVDIYDENNNYIYGFCAFNSPYDLTTIWFAEPEGTSPPTAVYVVLTDRSTTPNTTYTSNLLPMSQEATPNGYSPIAQLLVPSGGTNAYQFTSNGESNAFNYKVTYPALTGASNVDLVLQPILIAQSDLDGILAGSGFAGAQLVVYDWTGGYGVLFRATCQDHTTGVPVTCPTTTGAAPYDVYTNWDIPSGGSSPTNWAFLKAPVGTKGIGWQNIFTAYSETRTDPAGTGRSSPSFSDFIFVQAVTGTPPVITINTPPVGGAVYTLNQIVDADYTCTGTYVVSCLGNVASGSPIDTSSPGTKTFTVNAIVSSGPTATPQTVSYEVVLPAPSVSMTVPSTTEPYGYSFPVTATTNASTTAAITASGVCTVGTATASTSSTGTVTTATVNMTSSTGTCVLMANWAADTAYTTASYTETINAAPAPLTITANDFVGKVYGTTLTLPPTAFTASTLYNSDTVTGVTLASVGAAAGANVGTYAIVPSGAVGTGLGNYTITYKNGTLTVVQASSSTSLTSSTASDIAGQALTFTATVTDSSPGSTCGSTCTPTGTVQFIYSGVGTIASAVPLTNGVATFIYAPVWAGTATAVYSGDNNFTGSNSNAVGEAATAAPIASVSPAEVQFTGQDVHTTSQPQPVQISNIGTALLNISSISITGSASDDFSLTNNCPSSLPGLTSSSATPSSCTVYVSFTPDDTGVRTATLSITDNDPFSSPQLVGLTGLAQSAINSDFNRSKIVAGNYIWFTAQFSVRGPVGRDVTPDPVQIFFTNSTVTFKSNGVSYSLPAPNAVVVFSPTATAATTTYDTVNGRWVTTVPSIHPTKKCSVYTVDTRTFLTGFAFLVPAGGLPGDIEPVTWSGSFASDTPGVSVRWRWGAAVYTQFSTNYNALGVKPVEDDHEATPAWWTRDPAGTPENFKQYWTRGASGDDRDDFTGDPSRVAGASPSVAPLSLSPTELNFGSSQVGATSTTSPMTVTLTNNGAIPVTISGITVTGTNTGDFVIQLNNCASVPLAAPPSSSTSPPNVCTLSITFTPGDVGTRSGVLAITSGPDGNTQSTQTVDLGGNGTP